MVKISHYEVYIDRGKGWELNGHYPSNQRNVAFATAKEKENKNTSVKVVREDFDAEDNSYIEVVEYISGLSRSASGKKTVAISGANSAGGEEADVAVGKAEREKDTASSQMFFAIAKLILIIVLCLISSQLLLTLLVPVIEILVPEDSLRTAMFVVFFSIFLLMAIPFILHKVPWHVFDSKFFQDAESVPEKRVVHKADVIAKLYDIGESGDNVVVPSYPDAPIEQKRHIISFLSKLVDGLNHEHSLKNNFSKFGIKLIVFGGCLELARFEGMKMGEANTLLYEAFRVIDNNPSLENFYEAKKSYKGNKTAVYLTGIGAYLMAQVIKKSPINYEALREAFLKWEALNKGSENTVEAVKDDAKPNVNLEFDCIVNIQNMVRVMDDLEEDVSSEFKKVKQIIRNILFNLLNKIPHGEIMERDGFTSVRFSNLGDAIKVAISFFEDFAIYQEHINDEKLIIDNKCSILASPGLEGSGLDDFIEDVFDNVYNNEIIIGEHIKQILMDNTYILDFLGRKRLKRTGADISLYKLIY